MQEADELFEKIIKKFGSKSTQVWVNYARFLHAELGDVTRARGLIKRATKSLGSETHINLALLPKFAALEFRSPNGDRETGRTLFEQLLSVYPKKFDLWNQLMDLETSPSLSGDSGSGVDAGVIRDLFDRGSKVKGLKPKQAKTWFRRWAKWEEENGDKKSRERVSAKAMEWAKLRKGGGDDEKEDEDDEE